MPTSDSTSEFVSGLSRDYGPHLLRFLERMLGHKQSAEDVAQEAYLKLYRLNRPEEIRSPRALLFDVATKLAINRLRRVRTEITGPSSELDEVPDESPQPDRRAFLAEAVHRLVGVIDELPPNLRQVLVMRYVGQMPRQQIADQLHISVGAVEQRLTRALARCRERLAEDGIDWVDQ